MSGKGKRDFGAPWERTMQEFTESGLSQREFCRTRRIAPSTFQFWRKRLREKGKANPETRLFLPVKVIDCSPKQSLEEQSIEIAVGSTYTLRLRSAFESSTLNQILDVLEARK